ncbi:WYL domain-containing protein [Pseudoclavibacter sp. RFBJ3]|uniref:helix-turn-helix transcriptional regulator n=1 Tax=unclassified Pseudoclavibacter TaxID=2615177 RepID=UPI000CE85BFD|nr:MULTISPECIES: WYL domain-containing protein [unclassified Pseudoclavibacter]PPF84364.1 WYL domain-containing protein [Pseudoclavibacter sp. RFBJ5]PPF92735.1 WYL domain-containing protein [Pseudoclavibacter sp. RFBJ3]PPF98192.1 WYL domain-containing protein [Pseudoclavibacter sp. RFBH5]PPG25262.1 WYL domain-containing protein [Pseudoclavibacter sp. RFBI4]
MSPFVSADRLALLVSLVPYLRQQEAAVPVETAASHFGVSATQVRDAVRLIAVSGTPGDAGVYSHLDLFDINWDAFEAQDLIEVTHFVALEEAPRMSNREAAAVIAGLGFLRSLPRLVDENRIDDLLRKLGASGAAPHFAFGSIAEAPAARDAVSAALATRRRLRFRYRREDGDESVRHVDPFTLETLGGDLFLRGWCLERDAERVFRLDRMREAVVTDVSAESHPAAATARPIFTPSEEHVLVTIEAGAAVLPLLRDYLPPGQPAPAVDDRGRATVQVRMASMRHLSRLVAGNAGEMRVLAPASARAAVADWAATALREHHER